MQAKRDCHHCRKVTVQHTYDENGVCKYWICKSCIRVSSPFDKNEKLDFDELSDKPSAASEGYKYEIRANRIFEEKPETKKAAMVRLLKLFCKTYFSALCRK